MSTFPLRDKKLLALVIAILLLVGALFQYWTAVQSLWSHSMIHRYGTKPEHREEITVAKSPAKFYRAVNAAWLRGTGLLILSLGGFYYWRRFSKNTHFAAK